MDYYLYQKTGVAKSLLAQDLMSKNPGERILSISEYQKKFEVSRGTIQNAFTFLKNSGAIILAHHGHQGSYIVKLDYHKLQENCMRREILGIMPLPYSLTYEGFATAIYEQLSQLNFNMAYSRGAVGRIKLVESGTYQFAVCSQFAAEQSMREGKKIEIVLNFSAGSFLSKHVLLFAKRDQTEISDGMRVAYDHNSIDQSHITEKLVRGKTVSLVPIRIQQTIPALLGGVIDAGIWNYDDIIDNKRHDLNVSFLNETEYSDLFSTAVLIVRKDDEYLKALLTKNISIARVLKTLREVRENKKESFF